MKSLVYAIVGMQLGVVFACEMIRHGAVYHRSGEALSLVLAFLVWTVLVFGPEIRGPR